MKLSRFSVGSVLLTIVLGLSLLGCDKIPPVSAGEPSVSISYQETTATITVNWVRPANAAPSWNLYYEWTNERLSGGNNCAKAEATTMTTVTFTCSRSESTAGVMKFEVWGVRNVDGSLYPGAKSSAQYEVAPTGITPPDAPDSLTINVTDASGAHRQLHPTLASNIVYEVAPGTADTTWRYSATLVDGTVLKDLVVQTGAEHTGIQLTALVWKDEQVVACDGDCALYPDLMGFSYPFGSAPLVQAYNPFPPPVDVLGR